jgi:Fe-Mn family superoxide dismutase
MKPKGGGKNLPARVQKAIDGDLGGYDKARNDFIQAGITQFGSAGLGSR